MKEGWMDNASDLNSFSWWCFEHQINLKEAEKLAEKGVKLAETGRQKASILDTQAEIVYSLGEAGRALKLIEHALEEDPGREYLQKQLEKFRKAAAVN